MLKGPSHFQQRSRKLPPRGFQVLAVRREFFEAHECIFLNPERLAQTMGAVQIANGRNRSSIDGRRGQGAVIKKREVEKIKDAVSDGLSIGHVVKGCPT